MSYRQSFQMLAYIISFIVYAFWLLSKTAEYILHIIKTTPYKLDHMWFIQ